MKGLRRPSAALALVAVLATSLQIAGCHKEDNKPDPSLATNPKKDPEDYSSLRNFPLKDLLVSEVKVNGQSIPVWVMDTNAKQAEGFMYLREKDVPNGHGMIFIMPTTEIQKFYMANCFMELDIAYISPEMKVLNVVRGRKFDETSLPSSAPARFVLELKPGEAAKFGVKTGVKIEIPSDLKYQQ